MQTKKQAWQDQQRHFYMQVTWIDCARAYKRAHPLCERCLEMHRISPAEEVHHKIKLSPGNINKPDIVLNWDNLEALCKKCHQEEHNRERADQKKRSHRWRIDDSGEVILRDSPLGV